MGLSLNNVVLSSEDSSALGEFYTKVFGKPGWIDEKNGWFGWQIGTGGMALGPHDAVRGKSKEPARLMFNLETDDVKGEFERIKGLGAKVIAEPYEPGEASGMSMCTFEDPDGNYFQLATAWKPQ